MKKFVVAIILAIITTAMASAQSSAIRVEKNGTGEVILFLPGFTTPGSVWNETIKNLDKKYQVHEINYAGFNGIPRHRNTMV